MFHLSTGGTLAIDAYPESQRTIMKIVSSAFVSALMLWSGTATANASDINILASYESGKNQIAALITRQSKRKAE